MSKVISSSVDTSAVSQPAGAANPVPVQRRSLAELFQLAEGLAAAGQKAEAVELYKVWIAFNEAHPYLHLVYFNYSVMLRQLGDVAGSINALHACLKLDSRFGQAHICLLYTSPSPRD